MSEIVLKVDGLCKNFGEREVIKNLSFEVKKGEIFGLLGPNGAGKSTSIECILGIQDKTKGKVTILGEENLSKKIFEEIGVQFQASNYQDLISVKELCELFSSFYKDVLDYRELLRIFTLEKLMNSRVSKLSGGEKQKLSVILSLIHKPKIVFLDELTTGLDTRSRLDIWNFLKKLKKQGTTIFLTSHYMEEVEFLCDNIMIINGGEEVIRGSKEYLLEVSGKSSMEEVYLHFVKEEETDEKSYAFV